MKNAGAVLKAERLRKNKSLQDISKSTRISVLTLETLEGDHDDLMPPPTYVRGFLKSYAVELELDPDEILSIHDQEVQEQQKTAPFKKPRAGAQRVPAYIIPIIIVAVLLLACALYFGYMGRSSDITRLPAVEVPEATVSANKTPEQPVLSAVTTIAQEPAAVPAEPAEPAAPAAGTTTTFSPEPAKAFTVRFVAGERSWMRFTVDEKHVFEIFLKAGENYSVNAVSSVKVRIGNPGGLKAFYNDKPVSVPGKRGGPVDMSFPVAADAAPLR